MNDEDDLLKIKIDKARLSLPEDTRQAIAAVDWKSVIFDMREKKGYSFEQLGDLETETELLLCGLLNPESYVKELEKRMNIQRSEANELVNELNKLVFSKIREEMIKISENKKKFEENLTVNATPNIPTNQTSSRINFNETKVLDDAGIQILNHADSGTPEISAPTPNQNKLKTGQGSPVPTKPPASILTQKLGGTFQIPATKTEHKLDNISKPAIAYYPPKSDPYRLSPEE